MPPAHYVLSKEQRKILHDWVCDLKFLKGYASNWSRFVDHTNEWLHNLNSHNFHVFMERLSLIAPRELLPTNVWKVLTELNHPTRTRPFKYVNFLF